MGSTISAIHKFRKEILASSRNVGEASLCTRYNYCGGQALQHTDQKLSEHKTARELTKTKKEPWWRGANITKNHYLISPSAAYMRLRIGLALAKEMACRLFGAKPLS